MSSFGLLVPVITSWSRPAGRRLSWRQLGCQGCQSSFASPFLVLGSLSWVLRGVRLYSSAAHVKQEVQLLLPFGVSPYLRQVASYLVRRVSAFILTVLHGGRPRLEVT